MSNTKNMESVGRAVAHKFQTQYNYDTRNWIGEVNTLPSLTIPNMALTPAEIVLRFTSGQPVNVNNMLSYTGGDELYPDMRKLDLTEIAEWREYNKSRIEELKKDYETKRAVKQALHKQKMDEYQAIGKKPAQNESVSENVNAGENTDA